MKNPALATKSFNLRACAEGVWKGEWERGPSRSQSLRYLCPFPLDKGNEGSGNKIGCGENQLGPTTQVEMVTTSAPHNASVQYCPGIYGAGFIQSFSLTALMHCSRSNVTEQSCKRQISKWNKLVRGLAWLCSCRNTREPAHSLVILNTLFQGTGIDKWWMKSIAETIGRMTDWVCLLTGYLMTEQAENEVKKRETGPQCYTS